MCNVNNDMCPTCRLINFCADTVSVGDANCRAARALLPPAEPCDYCREFPNDVEPLNARYCKECGRKLQGGK